VAGPLRALTSEGDENFWGSSFERRRKISAAEFFGVQNFWLPEKFSGGFFRPGPRKGPFRD
jgi:hypothetical protein